MNSIFLRIYGGMLAAMLLVAAGAWGVVETVNNYREMQYNQKMLVGSFWLAANGVARHPGDERARWLQLLTGLFGIKFELLEASQVHFDGSEQEQLDAGGVVLRITDPSEPADVYIQVPSEPRYLTAKVTTISEQQWRATVLLVLDELGRHPLAEWDRTTANINAHFGYPVSRVTLNDVRLDRDQMNRLQRKEMVITLSDTSSSESGIRVHARIGDTGQVLMLGPIRQMDSRPWSLLIPLGIAALWLMGLAGYLLVRPLERRLKELEAAVQQVARGNLAVRAPVKGRDAVGQLATSFNGMTTHIARLIESQREMTRAVSHELRTPVARIRFGMEMLADVDSAAERGERIAAIDNDIDQLDALIDEILTYARLDEGVPSIAWNAVDIGALARQVQREMQPMAGSLRVEVLPVDGLMADGEERYLHRVMQNLVGNALRYARWRVQVSVLTQGEEIELIVEDDGPGIPVADRERVFKPFARLDDSRHRASGGYGLGLSIVQRIAEWHGGRVWVDQSMLGGAAFHMRWPRRRPAAHSLGR